MTVAKAKALRTNATDAERVLWHRLRAYRLLGYKFRRQQPMGNYIVDFVCFDMLRFWNHEVRKHLEAVTETILRECSRETPSP